MAGWADWEVISYSGTKHSSTNPDAASAGIPVALAYNKQTDQCSWKAMVNFFEEILA
jgi:dienelactone hydrolase